MLHKVLVLHGMLYNVLGNILKPYFWFSPLAHPGLLHAMDTDAANVFTTSERLIQEHVKKYKNGAVEFKDLSKFYTT